MKRLVSLRLAARILPLLCLAGSIVFVACRTTVPETGRSQVNFLSPSREAALGLSEFQRIKQEKPISRDSAHNELVQRVGRRLSVVMPVENAEWEFVVFDDPSPNAFALPGGKVGVHSGLFQITQNEAGLAAVIGHEVAHIVARHAGERLSQNVIAGAVVAGAGYAMNRDGREGGVAPTAVVGGGALLATRHFSRQQELEADRMGAIYMARAGYHPSEAVELWRRFAAWKEANQQGSSMPSFLSTHPVDQRRIEELERFLPEALREYRGS